MRDKKSNVFKSVMSQDIIILERIRGEVSVSVRFGLANIGFDCTERREAKVFGEQVWSDEKNYGRVFVGSGDGGVRGNIAVQAQLTRGPDVRLTRKHGDHYSDTGGFSGDGNNSGGRKENIRDIKNNGRNFPVATSGNYVYARRRGVADVAPITG